MNALEVALLEVTGFLEGAGIDYMVIGGFANLHWGTPRLTEDLDITVRVDETALPDFVSRLTTRFGSRVQDPVRFVSERGVLPVKTEAGIKVDVIIESNPLDSRAISRAVAVNVGSQVVRFCTAEDLILHKLVSERPRDHEDVEGIVIRQARSLDRKYLDPLVRQLTAALERPGIDAFYRACLTKAGTEAAPGPARRPPRDAPKSKERPAHG